MISHTTTNKGLGLIAIIAIVAAVGIGGVVAAKVYTDQRVITDEREWSDQINAEVKEAQEEARADLLDLQTRLQTNANASVGASLETIAEVRSELVEAYTHGNAELDAELAEIELALDRLEGEVRAGSESAANTISEIVASFSMDVDFDGDVSNETDGEDNGTTTMSGSASTTINLDGEAGADLGGSLEGEGMLGY